MEFRSHGQQPQSTQPAARAASTASSIGSNLGGKISSQGAGKWMHLGTVALLFSITALLVAVAGLFYTGKSTVADSVRKDKFQAVFLNNGQVYFGHIAKLSKDNVNLQNIYYLQTSGTGTDAATTANANVSLVKLGCELHAPYDQMLINNDQVIFWENLQDSSQVVKAIAEYVKQNPNGQKCSEASQSSTNQAPTTTTPQTTTPVTPVTPTTPTTKKP